MNRHGTGIKDAGPLQVHRGGGAEGSVPPVDPVSGTGEVRGRRVIALLLGLMAAPDGIEVRSEREGGPRHILA